MVGSWKGSLMMILKSRSKVTQGQRSRSCSILYLNGRYFRMEFNDDLEK
jgi:hypothetical protein